MPLEIEDGSQIEVQNLVMLLYALPGTGKTSLGLTASRPLILDFDGKLYRAVNSEYAKRVRCFEGWHKAQHIIPEDVANHDTIVVDTVGRVLDMLSLKLIEDDYKFATPIGGLSLQGYGALGTSFVQWMQMLIRLGKDVVLLAHNDQSLVNGEMVDRIDASGKIAKNEIHKVADVIAHLTTQNRKQILVFSPTDNSVGKNPGRFKDVEVPDLFMDRAFLKNVMIGFKDAMSHRSRMRKQEMVRLDALREELASIETLEDFNERVEKMIEDDVADVDKGVLMEVADTHGLLWDRQNKVFVDPEQIIAEDKGEAEQPEAAEQEEPERLDPLEEVPEFEDSDGEGQPPEAEDESPSPQPDGPEAEVENVQQPAMGV